MNNWTKLKPYVLRASVIALCVIALVSLARWVQAQPMKESLNEIAIDGPTEGLIHASHTFTATIDPGAMPPPITYTWEASAQSPRVIHSDALHSAQSFSWDTSGTKLITVTASNGGDAVVTGTKMFSAKPYMIYLPLAFRRWPPIPYMPNLHAIDNADGDGDYTVSWGQANLADTYTLQEDDNPAFSSPTTQYSGSELSWGANDRASGTYYYRVKATNSWGDSGWSDVELVSVVLPPPSPMRLYAHIDGDGEGFLSSERDAGGDELGMGTSTSYEFAMPLNSSMMGTHYEYSIYASRVLGTDYPPATCDVEILLRRDGSDTVLASWTEAFTVDNTERAYTGETTGEDPSVQSGDKLILRIRPRGGWVMIWVQEEDFEGYTIGGYSYIQVPGYVP